jgi:hypothetical protein
MQKRIVVRVSDQDDVSAPSSIAAAWATPRNEFLAAKSEASVATITGFYFNFYFVYEHAEKRKRPLGCDPGGRFLLPEEVY